MSLRTLGSVTHKLLVASYADPLTRNVCNHGRPMGCSDCCQEKSRIKPGEMIRCRQMSPIRLQIAGCFNLHNADIFLPHTTRRRKRKVRLHARNACRGNGAGSAIGERNRNFIIAHVRNDRAKISKHKQNCFTIVLVSISCVLLCNKLVEWTFKQPSAALRISIVSLIFYYYVIMSLHWKIQNVPNQKPIESWVLLCIFFRSSEYHNVYVFP